MKRQPMTDRDLFGLLDRAIPPLPEPPATDSLIARFRAVQRLETTFRRYELTGLLHWERVSDRLIARLARSA